MNINVTYHWTDLEYNHPIWEHHDTWGPVATIRIMAKMEVPFVKEKTIWDTYDVFDYVVEGNAGDPRDQIIKAIQRYADDHNIEIQFDFLKKWENKDANSMVCAWEDF